MTGQDLKRDLTFLLSIGANHVAYYPDDVHRDRPDAKTVSSILSANSDVKREDRPKKTAP
jgi:hypothetical protein